MRTKIHHSALWSVRNNRWDSIRTYALRNLLWESVRESVEVPVWESVWESVYWPLRRQSILAGQGTGGSLYEVQD
jgi:hypothetical protein